MKTEQDHDDRPAEVYIDDCTVYPDERTAAATLPVEHGGAGYPMAAPCPMCGRQARGVRTEIAVRQAGARLVKRAHPEDGGFTFGGHPVVAVEFTPVVVGCTADFTPCGCVWDASVPAARDLYLHLERMVDLRARDERREPVVFDAHLADRRGDEAMLDLRVGPDERGPAVVA